MISKDQQKVFSFDIDGTICQNTYGNYEEAKPFKERILILNKLFDEGNIINLFTARGSTTNIDWKKLTEKQLKDWGVKYHRLKLGKPDADLFIDDKGINADYFFSSYLNKNINRHINCVLQTFNDELMNSIVEVSQKISQAFKSQGKVILAGNGGSFSDCLHMSAELTGRFKLDRIPLPSIVLGSNGSSITAISNDYNFNSCFSREFEALGNKNDVLICLSTSGQSQNILKCLEKSKNKGIYSVLITSEKYNSDSNIDIDKLLIAKTSITVITQQIHIIIIHLLCEEIERSMGL